MCVLGALRQNNTIVLVVVGGLLVVAMHHSLELQVDEVYVCVVTPPAPSPTLHLYPPRLPSIS